MSEATDTANVQAGDNIKCKLKATLQHRRNTFFVDGSVFLPSARCVVRKAKLFWYFNDPSSEFLFVFALCRCPLLIIKSLFSKLCIFRQPLQVNCVHELMYRASVRLRPHCSKSLLDKQKMPWYKGKFCMNMKTCVLLIDPRGTLQCSQLSISTKHSSQTKYASLSQIGVVCSKSFSSPPPASSSLWHQHRK